MARNSFGHYTSAVVCRVPDNFTTDCSRARKGVSLNLDSLRKEHDEYVSVLRKKLRLDVIELPPDNEHPDCIFVEDTAIVINGLAFICKPGSSKRSDETDIIRKVLSESFSLSIVEIKDENARIDGGDILFTGEEFFVGLSSQTNQAGALALANAFPDYSVTQITLPDNVLHLKCKVSMAAPGIIVVGQSDSAQRILKQLVLKAGYEYQTVTVPDDDAANIIFINNNVIHCTKEEYPESIKILDAKLGDYNRISLTNTEMTKISGWLTSRCVPFLATDKIRVK